MKALETNNKEQVISNSIKTEITKPAIAKPILKTEENVTILNDEDNIINPTKVVPKRKGLVIIKKKRPEEQEVKVVKEDFEVKKTQKSLSDIFGENEEKNFENGSIPVKSKLILRKTFVVSKSAVIKKYGTVKEDFFKYTKKQFCKYFEC